jgi:exonuclease SbcC
MRLDAFSLKGITSITGTVSVDCRALPPGIIAVVGKNGAGKTTVLESMVAGANRRTFPSRSDNKLADYATGRDSFIENVYTLEGRGTFRTRINLDGVHGTTDAVLEQLTPDGGRVVLNDGKATTFDKAMAKLFPSPELLMASAFAAQNRSGSFITLSNKDRKTLFAELLGLAHFETMATSAKAIAADLTAKRAAAAALVARLEEETADAILRAHEAESDRLQIAAGTLEERERTAGADVAQLLDAVRVARETLDVAKERQRALETALTRQADRQFERGKLLLNQGLVDGELQRTLAEIVQRRDRAKARLDLQLADLLTAEAAAGQLTAQLNAIDERLAAALADKDRRIVNNQGVIDRGDKIRAAVKDVAAADVQIAEATRVLDEAFAALTIGDRTLQTMRVDRATREHLDADLAKATAAAALLADVPCGGVGPYAACQLLQAALNAQDEIPALHEALTARADLDTRIATLAAEVAEGRANHATAERDLLNLRTATNTLRVVAGEQGLLDAAEGRLKELNTDKDTLRSEAERERGEKRADHDARLAEAARRRVEMAGELAAIESTEESERTAAQDAHRIKIEQLTTAFDEIDAELATLAEQLAGAPALQAEVTDLSNELDVATADHERARQQQTQLAGDRATLVAQLAAHQATGQALKDKVAECVAHRAAATTIETHLLEWEVLAKALGRDGLPTLELDAAGPVVSDLCNDLLEFAFGSRRFTVELVTQEAKASGKGTKETFELHVYDSERGSAARSIADLSGGEQVILDEALKSAIAIFVNQRNEHPIRTCWRDETTGALDPVNALRYMDMLRRVLDRGGFHQIFVISHNPDAAAMADAQLHVHDGQIDVLFPPFAPVVIQEAA